MNRFTRKNIKTRILESVNLSVAFFVAAIVVFVMGISMIASKNDKNEKETLARAIQNDIIHCYAVEGYYPPNLSYMEEHYGLTYDSSKFIVDYETVGNNIMPTVMIVEKGQ